jgi:hypothetical protein
MKKQHIPLLIGIALPVLFILVISFVLFVPNLSIDPAYNFIYSGETSYGYSYPQYRTSYYVKDSRIAIANNVTQPNVTYKDSPDLFLYDIKNGTSHLITYEEAQKYMLDPGPSSPDGYNIQYEYGGESIFDLFGRNDGGNGFYVEKNRGKKSLPGLQTADRYASRDNFKFIGWVK